MTVELQNKKRKLDGKIFSFLSFNFKFRNINCCII